MCPLVTNIIKFVKKFYYWELFYLVVFLGIFFKAAYYVRLFLDTMWAYFS